MGALGTIVADPSQPVVGFSASGTQTGQLQPANGAAPSPYTQSFSVSSTAAQPTTIPQLNLSGFASAVVESYSNGSATLYALSSRNLGDVTIVSDPKQTAEFNASLTGVRTTVGSLGLSAPAAASTRAITFGGSNNTANGVVPATAVISASTFAGVAPGLGLSSVDSNTLTGIVQPTTTIMIPGTTTSVAATLPPSSPDLAWGFFLGNPAGTAVSANGDYIGLGFWTAGPAVPPGSLTTLTGSAQYTGGLIGTAVNGASGSVTTTVGQFAQTWNFGNQTGSLNASFDGRAWSGVPLNRSATDPGYVYAGSQTAGQGTLAVQGGFFNKAALTSGYPAATGGQFAITGQNYGANGILVGVKH